MFAVNVGVLTQPLKNLPGSLIFPPTLLPGEEGLGPRLDKANPAPYLDPTHMESKVTCKTYHMM